MADEHRKQMGTTLSGQEATLNAIRAKFSNGDFGNMQTELSKVLEYNEQLVREKQERVDARTKEVSDKLFNSGSWAANLPDMKSRDELVPAQRQYEIRQQAEKEVQGAYDSAGANNDNATSTETAANDRSGNDAAGDDQEQSSSDAG